MCDTITEYYVYANGDYFRAGVNRDCEHDRKNGDCSLVKTTNIERYVKQMLGK